MRWGLVDELVPGPWVRRDEPMLHELDRTALAMDVPLEEVVGSAPGWGRRTQETNP